MNRYVVSDVKSWMDEVFLAENRLLYYQRSLGATIEKGLTKNQYRRLKNHMRFLSIRVQYFRDMVVYQNLTHLFALFERIGKQAAVVKNKFSWDYIMFHFDFPEYTYETSYWDFIDHYNMVLIRFDYETKPLTCKITHKIREFIKQNSGEEAEFDYLSELGLFKGNYYLTGAEMDLLKHYRIKVNYPNPGDIKRLNIN